MPLQGVLVGGIGHDPSARPGLCWAGFEPIITLAINQDANPQNDVLTWITSLPVKEAEIQPSILLVHACVYPQT